MCDQTAHFYSSHPIFAQNNKTDSTDTLAQHKCDDITYIIDLILNCWQINVEMP